MSHYQVLDVLILQRLADGPMHLIQLDAGGVRAERDHRAELTGREGFRVLDGRLQALRKRGLIRFNSKTGWEKA